MGKVKKEKKTKEERTEEKRLKKEQKAEKKAGKAEKKAEKKGKTPKAPKPKKAQKPAKPQKAKVKKPKPTKAEKAQAKKDKLIVKNKRRAEKIRAAGARKTEKIQLKTANKAEKKQLRKELKAENKQFEKDLRQEIKDAKKEMPKSKSRFIIIPLIIVVLLAASSVFLHIRGIGPFGSFKMPEPPGFLKTVSSTVSSAVGSLHPVETIKSINPLKSIGSGGEKGVEKAIGNMFNSLISLDFEGAGEYVNLYALDIPDGYISIVDRETLMNATFDKLEYEIVSKPEKTGDSEFETAVSVTAVDVKHLMAGLVKGYTQFELDAIQTGATPDRSEKDKKAGELLSELVADPETGTVNTEITIHVNREGKICRIVPDDDLTDALFGGVIRTAGDFFAPESDN